MWKTVVDFMKMRKIKNKIVSTAVITANPTNAVATCKKKKVNFRFSMSKSKHLFGKWWWIANTPEMVLMESIENHSIVFDNYQKFHRVDKLATIPVGQHFLNPNHQPILCMKRKMKMKLTTFNRCSSSLNKKLLTGCEKCYSTYDRIANCKYCP